MHAKRIAFVYDWFDTEIGGAERVVKVFHEMYPDTTWYTLHIDHKSVPWAKTWNIRPSFIQKLPLWFRKNRILTLILMPFAFESFDLSSYDLVISISSGFAKNVITNANTKHICYLLTPPRWLYKFQIPSSKFQIINKIQNSIRNYFMDWDRVGAQRVDEYFSISNEVERRCKEFYGRNSEIIYPPFEYEYWHNLSRNSEKGILPFGVAQGKLAQDDVDIQVSNKIFPTTYHLQPRSYFLVVSRLKKYKKVNLAIKAFAKLKEKREKYKEHKLVIVGSGEEERKLKGLSRNLKLENEVVWLKNITDEQLAGLYANAISLIMPQEEDFGYTASEATACGAPTVCFNRGGQTEVIKNGENGIYFNSQNAGEVARALEEVINFKYNLGTYENSNIRGWSRHSFVAAFSQKIS